MYVIHVYIVTGGLPLDPKHHVHVVTGGLPLDPKHHVNVQFVAHFSGALTKGDRRAATGADLTEFNFDTQYGRNALRTMYHHICSVSIICYRQTS